MLHIFLCAHCPFCIFWWKISLQIFFPFHKLCVLFFFLLISKYSFYILEMSPWSEKCFANTFFQSVACLLIFLTVLSSIKSITHLLFWLMFYLFCLLILLCEDFSSKLMFISFIVLALTFRSVIQLEVVCVCVCVYMCVKCKFWVFVCFVYFFSFLHLNA